MTDRKKALVVFWITPLFMFLAAEAVTGNLLSIRPVGIVLNLAVYYLLYLGVWVLFGTNRGTWPVLNLALYALAAGEYFVISFRERPIMIWDVLALRTAMTVSSNYKFTLTPRLILVFLAVGFLSILAVYRPFRLWERGEKKTPCQKKTGNPSRLKKWLAAVGGYGLVCLLSGWMLFCVLEERFGLWVHMWDPVINFEEEGFLLTTVLSMENLLPEKPPGYTREAAEELLAAAKEEVDQIGTVSKEGKAREAGAPMTDIPAGNPEKIYPVNVICIMNESFSDLGIYNALSGETSFETDKEYLQYFRGLTENAEKGTLYVPVFGAMTANTEYEFLTGNSCALAPQGSIPFQFYTKPGDDSLARAFSENGYRTVAMHPYPGYNWNRTKAYENLGFEEFLDLDWYEGMGKEVSLEFPRGYMSDRSDYDGIIRMVESKTPGEKLFLFNVTMQNHGGYEVGGLDADVHVTKINGRECTGEFPKANQYLTLMRMSDEALSYLLAWFEEFEEPTMIVLFGDHQPSVETPFFEALYGTGWSQVPEEDKITSFQTPYLIWTNYDRPVKERRGQSAFMLGNDVLLTAGIPPNSYRHLLEQVREEYPVIHAMGAYGKDGQFTGFTSQNGPDSLKPVCELHFLQYYRMFDK